jgi:hypothetical protein
MSIKIIPPTISPLGVSPNSSGEVSIDPNQIDLERLRNVVAGRDTTFPRVRAISLLQAYDLPEKNRLLESLLENEQEDSKVRYVAAISLYKINTPETEEILIKNAQQIRDERVLRGVMKGLGRTGSERAFDVVLRVKERVTGLAASQADFAASLISYRLGLSGNELPVPDDGDFLELSSNDAQQFQVTQPSNIEAELCLRSLVDEPFGIEFSENFMSQVSCQQSTRIVLSNRDFTGQDAAQKLSERKAFLGVVATKSEETGLYSVEFLVLTSPARQLDVVNILIDGSNGEKTFGGKAQIQANRLEFSIRAISQPGVFPVQIEGTFEGGRLQFNTALSGVFLQRRRQPTKGIKPES